MRFNYLKATLKTAALAASILLLGVSLAVAQQINLTAGPATLVLPDGSSVPMWGYSCGAVVDNSTATCAKLNPTATYWSPIVITVAPGPLTITLTNKLSFAGGNIPTSLTIVGQLGGGLGTPATAPGPVHQPLSPTWPIAGGSATFNPPPQADRVRSFSTEVVVGTPQPLSWTDLRRGTYLIESGTHPSIQGPMGLYGILVVTTAPTVDGSGNETAAGTAYPGVTYKSEIPLLLSEIDPRQNKMVDTAVNTAGFSETMVWSGQPGGCGNKSAASFGQCYPPVVDYTPLYYLFNGVAFDKTHASTSLFPSSLGTPSAPVTGNVLVRLVNAGLKMHVPSIVGAQTGTAVSGFSLIAEDGNPLPGVTRVQSEVFMAAGKTYDVMINVPAACTPVSPATTCTNTALPIFDRELSLSGNAISRDAGMLAYIGINGAGLPAAPVIGSATATADTYNDVVSGHTLTISDPSLGVLANDVNVYGVKVSTLPTSGTLNLYTNGTFTYAPNAGTWTGDTFTYCGNGTTSGAACATVTLGACAVGTCLDARGDVVANADSYTSNVSTFLSIKTPGVLANDTDAKGYPLTVVTSGPNGPVASSGLTLTADANGGFNASVPAPGTYTFTYNAQNTQGVVSASPATVTLTFQTGSGLKVSVLDPNDKSKTPIADYRWIIEEDRTFFVDPNCTKNPLPAGCATVTAGGAPAVFGTNFHTSYMPVVASGCTGQVSCEEGQTVQGVASVCDVGNGICRPGTQQTAVDPSQVHLDPTKRYYISVLPGDAAQPFIAGYAGTPDCSPAGVAAGNCGHGMGGASIGMDPNTKTLQTAVTVLTEPSPYPPAKLTVFVFEDDWPLNGEHDAGGGIDVLSPQEAGLGGFQITLFDDAGGTGDATGQPTYDMFNQPLTNSLAGTIDPVTGFDACPISTQVTANAEMAGLVATPDECSANPSLKGCQKGIVGMIVTCPKYESDGKTLSPMAGQAVVNNLYAGRYGVVATPNADRTARGEEWLQTNTLDGQKAHDSFMRIGEPAYFQEFGPAGYHVSIGFANPKIINDRKTGMCSGQSCTNEVKGHVTMARMSRPPDERLYGSGSRDSFAFTQCYASVGDPDGADFAFVKCDPDGNFDFTGLPSGNWKLSIFDQWNDQIVDGISTPVGLAGQSGATLDMGEVAVHQWQANIYTRTFQDSNGDGVSTHDKSGVPCTAPNTPHGCNANYGNDTEPGLPLVATNIRFRDGSFSNFNNTDLNGYAGFNEVFPLFNWYTIETDTTRYKTTGVHVVYDAGGPTDGTCAPPALCGASSIGQNFANTYEANPLPADLSVPGAVYCSEGADCGTSAASFALGTPVPSSTSNHSSGRIDPPYWFGSYGWQGFSGQNSFLEFGKKPFAPGETGGIHGHVVYASTRPFDDPQLLLQLSWEPLIPHVRVNLYKEGAGADGTTTLTLVDHTETSSFDDWVQGFRSDGNPNMSCPGQSNTDLYFYGLQNQPNYLDWYNSQHGGPGVTQIPYQSQYKCYDGMHNWNQLQPAPYDGMYSFPSVIGMNPTTGHTTGTNCTVCVKNPDASDTFRFGKEDMLPAGKYVVEVVVPPGYELVKEEDKNILIGDNYIAPVTQQFGGLGSVFILPDQAELDTYNGTNAQDPTQNLGRNPILVSKESDTGSVETFWPCVGALRTVPDFISLFPGSSEVAPFAGAQRNLCDRKEVTLTDQTAALAKFYVFTSTHVAAHYTGVITDDFTAEFDPFSPQFGEKFAPAYLPVSIKDWAGNEISRTHSDQWGAYNGLNYSTWEVNPPNPTGYGPTMMVTCMNDAGTGPTPDPLYQAGYSQFCYELPFMPGQTGYFDTPVVPTSAFSEGYNHPDCAYPDATPAVSEVDGDGVGPWVSAPGNTLTIKALGDQLVDNQGYSGPQVDTGAHPWAKQKVTRHYGFGDPGTVTIGGVAATVTSWDDTSITVTVPSGVPACAVQQQAQSAAQCGQLVITSGNGKQSVDTVTVTIGGKAPTVMTAGTTIQSVIDAAIPGDLIIVPPGVYNEMLLMWKPVRLQGVGAASSIINADPHPAGKLDPWRRQVVCVFGLALNGTPISGSNAYDPSGTFNCTSDMKFSVDRLPLEATVGWTAVLNGNLAEQLAEPSLMGSYEGAGITVLAKGVDFHTTDPAVIWASDVFPTGTTLLTTNDCSVSGTNPYPSNFLCNPSSIDGLSVTNSSQGGGGILVHGWGHNIQIANNRVRNNQGTLSGGITVGQGEHPDAYLAGAPPTTIPGSCETSAIANQSLPFCFDMHVNIHNNALTVNSSLGDELFSSTPAGAGGATLCNGSDYYNFNYNWVCGNMSTGDGAGVAHLGLSKNGSIQHNSILFNQSTNPTITTNGGGLLVMGAPDVDPPCSITNDNDCLSPPNTISPSDGTGPGLVINANLIMGNSADSGSGGGLRLQHINGNDVLNFPNGQTACPDPSSPSCLWNSVQVTNNIITNNVAGWDGGGVSLQDALAVNIVNNTIVSNDSTASAGPLFSSLFSPLASTPGENCTTTGGIQSCPQVAGLVSVTNSAVLQANLPLTGFSCPPGHGTSGSCSKYSVPLLANNVIWQNRSFVVGVGDFGGGNQNQQKTVTLYNSAFNNMAATVTAPTQSASGGCPTSAGYWDIGVRGDLGPADHTGSGATQLNPMYSVLTDTTGYDSSNLLDDPRLVSQYCNGSRVPPELGSMGYTVDPGTNETNALPTPVFSLTPAATVDEGNNWINLRWGPFALAHPVTGATLGNYVLAAGSPAIDHVPSSSPTFSIAPPTDFFGNPRPDPAVPNKFDIGATEYQYPQPQLTSISPSTGYRGYSTAVTLTGIGLIGTTAVNVSGSGVTVTQFTVVNDTTVTATFVIAPTATLGNDAVTVVVGGFTSTAVSFTVTNPPPPTISISPASGYQGYTVPVTITGTWLLTESALTVSGTGITVSGVSVVNDTTITATFAISATAATGSRNVTVTTLGGTSNIATFTVQKPPTPTLTLIVPNSGVKGNTYNVTLTGTSLLTTLTNGLTVSGSGVVVSNIHVVNDTKVTATFAISPSTLTGARTVTLTTLGGTATTTFTVLAPPALTSIAPTSGVRGTTVPVTLTGTGLTGTTAVNVSGTGITVSGITVVSATTVTANFAISNTASLSARNVSVSVGNATSNNVTFTVTNAAVPTLTSIAPISGVRGTGVPVTLTGTGLTGTTAVNVTGNRITVSGITVVNDSTVTATFTISNNASLSARNVSVTTPGGTSNTVTFTVTGPPPPTLTSITPNSGVRGTTVPVTLTGANLTAPATVNVSGFGITVGAVTVVNSTTATTTFTISAGATASSRNVSITTASGTSGNVTFTVQGATLSSIAPTTGVRGTAVPVVLTGTNLTGATAVIVSGTGITVSALTVVNSTTVNATFTITSGATLGNRNVSVTTPAGTTGTVAFTVQGATLSGITPTSGLHNTAVPVTLTGTNLTGATAVSMSGFGVTCTVTGSTSTTVNASCVIANNASRTARSVSVATPIGNTNTLSGAFTVN